LKLKDIFGQAVHVKLDPFHWLKRWNEALLEPTSVQGGIARQMFSRAIFNIDAIEMEEAKNDWNIATYRTSQQRRFYERQMRRYHVR